MGVWKRNVLIGAGALAVGAATTIAGLSVIPLVRFPEDQYLPAALWVIADSLPLVVAFITATLAGRVIRAAGVAEESSRRAP